MLVTPRCSRVWLLTAVIEIGVFWTFSARCSAVTTTSETVLESDLVWGGADWAWAEPAAPAASRARAAAEASASVRPAGGFP